MGGRMVHASVQRIDEPTSWDSFKRVAVKRTSADRWEHDPASRPLRHLHHAIPREGVRAGRRGPGAALGRPSRLPSLTTEWSGAYIGDLVPPPSSCSCGRSRSPATSPESSATWRSSLPFWLVRGVWAGEVGVNLPALAAAFMVYFLIVLLRMARRP